MDQGVGGRKTPTGPIWLVGFTLEKFKPEHEWTLFQTRNISFWLSQNDVQDLLKMLLKYVVIFYTSSMSLWGSVAQIPCIGSYRFDQGRSLLGRTVVLSRTMGRIHGSWKQLQGKWYSTNYRHRYIRCYIRIYIYTYIYNYVHIIYIYLYDILCTWSICIILLHVLCVCLF